jgi:hypothetical protein
MDDFIGKIFTIGGFTGKFMEIPSMKGPEFFASDSQESADFPAIQWLPFSVRIQVPSLESTLAPLRILEISPRDFVRPYVPYGGNGWMGNLVVPCFGVSLDIFVQKRGTLW